MSTAGIRNAAVMQVTQETGLINRSNGAKAHGYGGKLPEIGHEPRVWVGRNAPAPGFLTEVADLFLSNPTFDKSACVDAG